MADSAQRLSELEVTSPGPCQRPQLPPPDPLKLNESTCSRQRWASCSVLTTNPAMTLRRRAALHTLLQAATENSSTLEVQSSATVFNIKPADILEELRQEIKQRGQRLVPLGVSALEQRSFENRLFYKAWLSSNSGKTRSEEQHFHLS